MTTRKARMFTPKEARQMLGIKLSDAAKADTGLATERQAAALAKFAIEGGDKISFTAASDLLGALCPRIDAKLCSLRQMAWLMEKGNVPADQARETPFADASRFIQESKG